MKGGGRERERGREREGEVPVDLSVKRLGLVFSASLLLFCSKQCCLEPPVHQNNIIMCIKLTW